MSVAEFLAWNAGDDLRYELVDGVPVAQSAPSAAHGVAATNIAATIRAMLRASRRPSPGGGALGD
jgi:Uma2 family endonuclease